MCIQLISISHKTASLDIRALFAFNSVQQTQIMAELKAVPAIEEVVMIATCNRTEIYTYSPDKYSDREIFGIVQAVLMKHISQKSDADISHVLRFYSGQKAVSHLFEVACGLDSMVMGEDQILGQVKEAHQQAMDAHMSGTYLNTLFRYAITAAKKAKTDTVLSKTSVSTASLCIKAAHDYMNGLNGKNVLLIGASGKIGGIVARNLLSEFDVHLFVTVRSCIWPQEIVTEEKYHTYTMIPYEQRYTYLKDMDVVISATASPHYTLTYENVMKNISPGRKMAFMDLAVPMDIDSRIGNIDRVLCLNIDDFSKEASENNHKKMEAAIHAMDILNAYIMDFSKWMVFQQSLGIIDKVKSEIIEDCAHKGIERAIDKLFYKMRDGMDAETLRKVLESLKV